MKRVLMLLVFVSALSYTEQVQKPELSLLDQKQKNNVWNDTSAQSFAVGWDNKITNSKDETSDDKGNSFAVGKKNDINGDLTATFGSNNKALGGENIAVGYKNDLKKKANSVIGIKNNIDGQFNTVLGINNEISGDNSFVMGNNNKASKDSYIIGQGIDGSNAKNSIVLGNKSEAVADALSIGSKDKLRKIVNVDVDKTMQNNLKEAYNKKAGLENEKQQKLSKNVNEDISKINESIKEQDEIIKSNSSYAATGGLVYEIKYNIDKKIDANKLNVEKNRASIASIDSAVKTNGNNIANLNTIVEGLANENKEINKQIDGMNHKIVDISGDVAAVAAMTNLPPLSPNSRFSVGVAYGYSKGQSAGALGFVGASKNNVFTYKGSIGISSSQSVSFGLGLSLNIIKREKEEQSYSDLKKEIEYLKKEIENLKNAK